MRAQRIAVLVLALAIVFGGPTWGAEKNQASHHPPTVQEAERFIEQAEARLNKLAIASSQADWVQATYITNDTEALAASARGEFLGAVTELAHRAKRFEAMKLPPPVARKLKLLKLSVSAPAPQDQGAR